jgi:hypothetical protein
MASTIIPKSDQLNSDDLISGPMTVKITGVTIKSGTEQPIAISFEGDNGKPYKACKSMCRVMVTAWGADSKKYVGHSMTLYRDAAVKWGGMEVGGIRISHMSDIDKALTMALTVTRANKKPFTVKPIVSGAPKAAQEPEAVTPRSALHSDPPPAAAPTPDEALLIKAEEFASTGTERYKAWWLSITEQQRKAIGEARHSTFKQIAAAA